jgi:hypothetical protein
VATANAHHATPPAKHDPPSNQHRRGVEGGSSPLGITGGGWMTALSGIPQSCSVKFLTLVWV